MTTKADRTRNLRYKRPALASLGLDIITMEMAEITEACADILWAINDVFSRYGAESFAYATTSGKAILAFQIHGKQIRISVSLPKIEDFRLTENGRERTAGPSVRHGKSNASDMAGITAADQSKIRSH